MAHRLFLDAAGGEEDEARMAPGATLVIGGEEAEHARKVKRLEPGGRVTVLNGRGMVAEAEVVSARRELVLRVLSCAVVGRAAEGCPEVEAWTATPKGSRLDEMIDALSQVGASLWRPMSTKLGVVDPRENKLARMERIVREASKQCGRAWVMRLGPPATFEEGIAGGEGVRVVLADAGAPVYSRSGSGSGSVGVVRVLIGPEGGWTAWERERACAAGVGAASFGVHTMRIEQAAAAACAIVMDVERRG